MRTRAEPWLLAGLLALAAGCAGDGGRGGDWDRPAAAVRPLVEAEVVAWPPAPPMAAREVRVQAYPGPALVTAAGLAVPTGRGLRLIPLQDGQVEGQVATPGWAQRVVEAGEGRWWVADGFRGIAVVEGEGGTLRVARSWIGEPRAGQIVDLRQAGVLFLALSADGWLLVLEAGDDGGPVERARLLLDGKPWNLDVWPADDGWAWVASAQEGGVLRGGVTAEGEPWLGPAEESRSYAYAAAGSPELVVASRPTGTLVAWPPRGDLGAHSVHSYSTWIDPTGEAWFACGSAGLFRGLPEADAAETPLRHRAGAGARAVAPGLDGVGTLVSWDDGLVEHVDDAGMVRASWDLGPMEAIHGVHGPWVVTDVAGQGTSRLAPRAGDEGLVTPAPVIGLGGPPATPLVSLGEGGVAWLAGGPQGPVLTPVGAAGVIVGADVDGAGRIWAVDNSGQLQRLAADGSVEREWTITPDWEAMDVAADDRWVVAAERHNGDVLARPVDDDEASGVRAFLPGKGHDVEILGDVALVGVSWFGVAAVPLGADPLPTPALLPLPRPMLTRAAEVSLCRTPGGVLATLGELGLADVRLEPDGALRLERVIETPGYATDCTPGEAPDTYLVADWTGVIELTLPMGDAAP